MSKLIIGVLGKSVSSAENVLISRYFPPGSALFVLIGPPKEEEFEMICKMVGAEFILLPSDSPIPIWAYGITLRCLKLINGTLLEVTSFKKPMEYKKFKWNPKRQGEGHGG